MKHFLHLLPFKTCIFCLSELIIIIAINLSLPRTDMVSELLSFLILILFIFSGYIKHSKTGNIFICWWKLLLGENCGQSWETEVNNKIELFILTTIFYYLQVGLMTTPPDSILPVSSVLLIISILEESFTEISSQKIFY